MAYIYILRCENDELYVGVLSTSMIELYVINQVEVLFTLSTTNLKN